MISAQTHFTSHKQVNFSRASLIQKLNSILDKRLFYNNLAISSNQYQTFQEALWSKYIKIANILQPLIIKPMFIQEEEQWGLPGLEEETNELIVPQDIMVKFPIELPFEYRQIDQSQDELLENGLQKIKLLIMFLLKKKKSKSALLQIVKIIYEQTRSEEYLRRAIQIKSLEKELKRQDLSEMICREILTLLFVQKK